MPEHAVENGVGGHKRPPDRLFAEPRLAAIHDALDGPRDDLDHYIRIAHELRARSVLDVGCGTGILATRLADEDIDMVGVDPAEASLTVARGRDETAAVTWLLGDATTLPELEVDLALMTGNVAQVFLGDDEWTATLRGIERALRPGGTLVFEARDPQADGWQAWTRAASHRRIDLPGVGCVETWVDLTEVSLPLVSFRWTFVFEADGAVLTSDSTLRFRERDEIESSLGECGYEVSEVRDAPDRPDLEFVFVATTSGSHAAERVPDP